MTKIIYARIPGGPRDIETALYVKDKANSDKHKCPMCFMWTASEDR